ATRAAIAAGYSPKTAFVIANENLRKPYIQAHVNQIQSDLEKSAKVSKLRVLEELVKIAFSSMASIHNTWIERKDLEELSDDQRACIVEIETRIVKKNIGTRSEPDIVDVEQIKVKLHDKLRAIDAINRLMGYEAPKKSTIDLNQRIDELNGQQLDQLIEKLLNE